MTDDVEAVRAAYERTVAAGTARITCGSETHWQLPQMPEKQQRSAAQQAVIGIGTTVAKSVGKGLLRLITRKADPWHRQATGYVDLLGRRMQIDYGSFAELQIGDQEWSGRSGRPLDTLPAQQVRQSSPLWTLELLAGVDHATRSASDPDESDPNESGTNDSGPNESSTAESDPDGAVDLGWQRFSATASLPAAIAVHGRSMSTPARDRYEDLLAIPVTVWIDDDGFLRRVQCKLRDETYADRTVLTLHEFGVDVDHLDWSRLPTFRSPEEAWNVGDRARRAGS